jgi:hypothetical protein
VYFVYLQENRTVKIKLVEIILRKVGEEDEEARWRG